MPKFDAKPLTANLISANNSTVIKGASLFANKGRRHCHLVDGHGGPELTEAGRRLTPGSLRICIVNGGGNMPAYSSVVLENELATIIAFLETRC